MSNALRAGVGIGERIGQAMSRVTKTVCDRCGEEIKYQGWTAKFPFKRKKPFMLKLLKLHNGNPSGYDYSERECELCNKCTFELNLFLEGGKVVNEQN